MILHSKILSFEKNFSVNSHVNKPISKKKLDNLISNVMGIILVYDKLSLQKMCL